MSPADPPPPGHAYFKVESGPLAAQIEAREKALDLYGRSVQALAQDYGAYRGFVEYEHWHQGQARFELTGLMFQDGPPAGWMARNRSTETPGPWYNPSALPAGKGFGPTAIRARIQDLQLPDPPAPDYLVLGDQRVMRVARDAEGRAPTPPGTRPMAEAEVRTLLAADGRDPDAVLSRPTWRSDRLSRPPFAAADPALAAREAEADAELRSRIATSGQDRAPILTAIQGLIAPLTLRR